MAPMYILANDLSTHRTRSAIKVRVVRSYLVLEGRGSSSVKSKEVVLHDEEGTVVHAHIPKEYVEENLARFKEGRVYGIKNFFVVTNSFTYKTSNHRYMIRFNDETVHREYQNDVFPRYMFRLKAFNTLKDPTVCNEKELIDVIGCVVEIHSPQEMVISGKTCRLIDFVIQDEHGNQLQCTVWDDHVPKIEPYFQTTLCDPVVVLLQFCRVKKTINTGEIKICSSYDVTQLHVNEDFPEFLKFNESLRAVQTPMRSIASQSTFSYGSTGDFSATQDLSLVTISEVYQRKEYGDYWVAATIAGVDNEREWYYISCKNKGCHKKLDVTPDGFYMCGKCTVKWGVGLMRYRVKIRVVDCNGNAPFLLWDRECNQLLGVEASVLKDKQQETRKLPKEIKSLVGQSMLFRIAARKEQFANLQNAFPVMRIINDTKLVATHCPELLDRQDKDLTTELHLSEYDANSDEEFLLHLDEAESPAATITGIKAATREENGPVKRSLLDEFSSSLSSKKTKECCVKIEKTD